MQTTLRSLLVTSFIAVHGATATAQTQPPDVSNISPSRTDSTRLEQVMARRSAQIKARLQLTPAQEPAWNALMATFKPAPVTAESRPDPAELANLSTPERIDRLRALRIQRMNDAAAAIDKRDEATKAFYATLNAEQKKVFDEAHATILLRMSEHRRP